MAMVHIRLRFDGPQWGIRAICEITVASHLLS